MHNGYSGDSIRGGIVGFGGIARTHAAAYQQIPGVSIVAVADPTPVQLSLAGKELEIGDSHLYPDYRKMLDGEKLDFLDVCVPHNYHREIVIAGTAHGLNVICEKPLAMSLVHADEMVEAARAAGVHLATCHNWCYHPVFATVKGLVDEGRIGPLLLLQFEAFQTSGIWRGAAKDYLPEWRTMLNRSGGGALMDTGFHFCYLSTWLAGSRVTAVNGVLDRLLQADYDVEDYSKSMLRYQNGCISDICVGWFGEKNSLRVVLRGEQGSLSIPSPSSPSYGVDPILVEGEHGTESVPILREEGGKDATWQHDFLLSYKYLLADFLSLLRDGVPPRNPIAAGNGRMALEVVLASYESAATGRETVLPLSKDDPLYPRGVEGLRDVELSRKSPIYQKNIFAVRS